MDFVNIFLLGSSSRSSRLEALVRVLALCQHALSWLAAFPSGFALGGLTCMPALCQHAHGQLFKVASRLMASARLLALRQRGLALAVPKVVSRLVASACVLALGPCVA